ncbi:MAG: hypothetical protein QOD90_2177 [Mycobacterium sp.]|nr:hypothetical protein [Mycobacterium sp.]
MFIVKYLEGEVLVNSAMAAVPAGIDDVTAPWLSDLLRADVVGIRAERIALLGWEVLPERSRQLCLTLTDRAMATIDEIDAVEVFDD